jgi:hypothetical protein
MTVDQLSSRFLTLFIIGAVFGGTTIGLIVNVLFIEGDMLTLLCGCGMVISFGSGMLLSFKWETEYAKSESEEVS